jgi:hypothetical protein
LTNEYPKYKLTYLHTQKNPVCFISHVDTALSIMPIQVCLFYVMNNLSDYLGKVFKVILLEIWHPVWKRSSNIRQDHASWNLGQNNVTGLIKLSWLDHCTHKTGWASIVQSILWHGIFLVEENAILSAKQMPYFARVYIRKIRLRQPRGDPQQCCVILMGLFIPSMEYPPMFNVLALFHTHYIDNI